MTTVYNIEIELAARADDPAVDPDPILDRYAGKSPAVGSTIRGWVSVTVSVEAATMLDAIVAAVALAPLPIVSVEAMTAREFDRRIDAPTIPPLMSVSEAAEVLGVTRNAVQQRIQSGSLPARKVGSTYVVPSAAVNA